MRIHSRLLLGMFGLALAVPTVAVAAPFGDDEGTYAAPGGQPQPQTTPHHHKGLFGRRHCVECQRAYVKAHDGVDVPAPPPIESGAMMHGQVMAGQGSSCPTCQGNAVVTGPVHGRGCACSRLRGGRWPGRDGERGCSRLRGGG